MLRYLSGLVVLLGTRPSVSPWQCVCVSVGFPPKTNNGWLPDTRYLHPRPMSRHSNNISQPKTNQTNSKHSALATLLLIRPYAQGHPKVYAKFISKTNNHDKSNKSKQEAFRERRHLHLCDL